MVESRIAAMMSLVFFSPLRHVCPFSHWRFVQRDHINPVFINGIKIGVVIKDKIFFRATWQRDMQGIR